MQIKCYEFFLYIFDKGGTAPPIQDAIGSTMSFDELKELLYKSGINLFPDKDAFCYCESNYLNFLIVKLVVKKNYRLKNRISSKI